MNSTPIVGTNARLYVRVGGTYASTLDDPVWEEVSPVTMQPFTPTSDGDALQQAVIAFPAEDTPRLAYADWLQEHGQDGLAEFIRVQIESARLPYPMKGNDPPDCVCGPQAHLPSERCGNCQNRLRLIRREHELFRAFDCWDFARWAPSDWTCTAHGHKSSFRIGKSEAEQNIWHHFRRGLVESLECAAVDWLKYEAILRKRHPITQITLSDALEMAYTEEDNDHRGANCQWTIRVCARGFCEGGPVPAKCYLSSPATDVLVSDRVAGMIPAADFKRAVFDRFWPGVNIVVPPAFDAPSVYEEAFGESRGRDSTGPYRRRYFRVGGARSAEQAVRACGIRLGAPHPLVHRRFVATSLNAQEVTFPRNWSVTVVYRPPAEAA